MSPKRPRVMSSNAAPLRTRHFAWLTFLGMLALLVLLVLVGALGLLAYRKLDAIIQTAAEANQAPGHDRQLVMREMLSDMYVAENHAIMYSLGRDETHLQAYEESAETTLESAGKLSGLLDAKDALNDSLSRRLIALVKQKFRLLDMQLALQQYRSTDEVLDQLSHNLQKAMQAQALRTKPISKDGQENPAVIVEPEEPFVSPEEQKKHATEFYKWMMGMPVDKAPSKVAIDTLQPAKTEEPFSPTLPLPQSRRVVLPAAIDRELETFALAESDRYRENLQRDVALTVSNQEVSGLIRSVVSQIDQLARKASVAKSEEVATTAKTANTLIIFFCVLFSSFLVLIAVGIIFYFRAMRRNELNILAAKTQAEVLADTRARFLATMSHEIRTPMNVIMGFTNQLLKSHLEKAQREHMILVHRAADHLLGIVNTVLDFSRLSAGQMQYSKQDFALASEVQFVVALLQHQFDAKGLDLQVTWQGTAPSYVKGDPLRLRQILLNLLSNSLKFTELGTVMLVVETPAESSDLLSLKFTVIDTGMGIPAERLSAVFNAFEQSDATISRQFGGSGLGLSITKMLVEQQGGDIGIDSKIGDGTTIWFMLPFELGEVPNLSASLQKPYSGNVLEGKRVLIADDEPYNRKLLQEILTGWGMECQQVADGQLAVDAAQAQTFDILLLDLRMPELDGYEATRRIREEGLSRGVPILILTASSQAEEAATSKAAGCDGILGKPFSEDVLKRHLEALVAKEALPPTTHPHPHSLPVAPDEPLFSFRNLANLVGDDTAFLKEMVIGFIEAAHRAQQAIHAAMQAQAPHEMVEAAHKLAAPAKHLEARLLYGILKELEKEAGKATLVDGLVPLVAALDDALVVLLPALHATLPSHDGDAYRDLA